MRVLPCVCALVIREDHVGAILFGIHSRTTLVEFLSSTPIQRRRTPYTIVKSVQYKEFDHGGEEAVFPFTIATQHVGMSQTMNGRV